LLAHGRWFSPGTPDSSITKTGRRDYHDDIAEIMLKVALKHHKSNQIKSNQFELRLFIRVISLQKLTVFESVRASVIYQVGHLSYTNVYIYSHKVNVDQWYRDITIELK
jgi:hypothetical protein